MTMFNVVRFRVKEGRDEDFLAAHRDGKARWPGLVAGHIIKTGERSYCLIGEWADADAIKAARPQMIATLDSFRDTLEDQGDGRGLTDAVSGPRMVDLTA